MRPGATRIESIGSIWWLDDDRLEYLRAPKHEGPRTSPEDEDWGGPGAGELQDLRWHPMVRWHRTALRLIIELDDDGHYISAPLTWDEAIANILVEELEADR